MLRHKIVIFSILALLVFLTACRSEPAPTSGNASVSAASRAFSNPGEPTIQQAMAGQPGGSQPPGAASDGQTPTPPQNPLAVAGSAESVPIGLSPAADPAVSAAASPETAAAESTPSVEEDLAIIQGIIEEYWAALNDYDVDHAITMLEESYREEEEELIRSDIGRMKLFRVKLGVSEETPLTLNAEGDYETYLTVKTPVDSRRVLTVFRHIDGQWWIVFLDEVE